MIKLYARDEGGALHYHEAWLDNDEIVEHWGLVGQRGETLYHDISAGGDRRASLDAILADARSSGFCEVDRGEHDYVDVVYERELFAPSAYLDVCDRTRSLLNEELGWTGVGHCEGSRIDSTTISVRSAVVDVEIAERVLRALPETGPSEFTIAVNPPLWRTPPELIRIGYENYSSRTNALGRHADGQFLALITSTASKLVPGAVTVALLLFDDFGNLVGVDIRGDVPWSDAEALREQLIQGLADVAFGDIAIKTFSLEDKGVTWCLVDETEHGQARVSLSPLDIVFSPPWDGTYDT